MAALRNPIPSAIKIAEALRGERSDELGSRVMGTQTTLGANRSRPNWVSAPLWP
jgi:hypothetical protein